jgi:hypothetical protein
MALWQAQVDELRRVALQQAEEEADAWELDMLARTNPMAELMGRVIAQYFPTVIRDEAWEIELWQQLFDWDRASYSLQPSWWSDMPVRDPTEPPNGFFNASWAKLYLPIKIGNEMTALRWIFGRAVDHQLDPEKEAAFQQVVDELSAYRTEHFGDPSEATIDPQGDCGIVTEKVICLGQWTELLPTDGTHVEVALGTTSAIDAVTQLELNDAKKLRAARIAKEEQAVLVEKKAVELMKTANVEVHLHLGSDDEA